MSDVRGSARAHTRCSVAPPHDGPSPADEATNGGVGMTGRKFVKEGDGRGRKRAGQSRSLEPLMDAAELAVRLGVPTSWVTVKARQRRLPSIRIGRVLRFDPQAVAQWLEDRRS